PRHLADRYDDAVLAGELGHEGAVASVDLRPDRRDIFGQLLVVLQIAAAIDELDAEEAADPDRRHDDEDEQDARDPAQGAVHHEKARDPETAWHADRAWKPPWMASRPRIAGLRLGVGSAIVSLPRLMPGPAGTI